MWRSWLIPQESEMKQLGDTCNVTAKETLQYVYYRSTGLHLRHHNSDEELWYQRVVLVSQHLNFYKDRWYPFLPRTSYLNFCHYNEDGQRLVCDEFSKTCVDCQTVDESNEILYEACSPKEKVQDPDPTLPDGVQLYENVTWTNRIVSRWAQMEDYDCDATPDQTLAFTRMRKRFLADGMKNGRDAQSKSEWVKEWRIIEEKFENPANVKNYLNGFSVSDAERIFCAPHRNPKEMILNGDDRLVCNGKNCVFCKNPPPYEGTETFRFSKGEPLYEACQEMNVQLRIIHPPPPPPPPPYRTPVACFQYVDRLECW